MAQEIYNNFVKTLKSLFMFEDAAELDFGIYRILKLKHADIEEYLDKRLKAVVEQEIEGNQGDELRSLIAKRDEMVQDLMKYGVKPQNSEGYVELCAKIDSYGNPEEMQADVFSHLNRFFTRYYEDGDFISKRRYKKGDNSYAIPYSGEEVKLYWANEDQYYIKTGEYFRNYKFQLADGKYCEFTLKDAEQDQNNNIPPKDQIRCFALAEEEPIEVEGDVLHINFTYLTYKKVKDFQKKLIAAAYEAIKDKIPSEFLSLMVNISKDSTLLQKHLAVYVAKNTCDYFIHKDLRRFLTRELDFYIKNEVLFIDDIDVTAPQRFVARLAVAKAIKRVGAHIINMLAQLEDYQKRLWLKKKFVTDTEYCITLDRVPHELYQEIAANDLQREEWVKLFAIDEIRDEGLGLHQNYSEPLTVQFLEENQHLVLDTQFFSDDFKHRLLEILPEKNKKGLDDLCNGLLINSENFQALQLLQEKYQEKVQCIYIDPPYNTGGDDFLYKDKYQESSWLSCINDRLLLSKPLFAEGGSIAVSIDIKELDKLIALLDSVLGYENRKANITVRRASITGAKVINPGLVNISENVVMYSNGMGKWIPKDAFKEKGYDDRYNRMVINKNESLAKWEFSTVLEEFAKAKGVQKAQLKKMLGDSYEQELYDFAIKNADSIFQPASLDLDSVGQEAVALYEKSKREPNKIFHFEREGDLNDYYLLNGKILLFYKDRLKMIGGRLVPVEKVSDIWDDVLPNDIHNEGGVTLKKGKKPEKLIDRIFESTTQEQDLVLDYFAGSGTSGAVGLKSNRRFINVEMNDYFTNITLRRIKNTLFGDTSGVTDIHQWKGGGMVKYIRLEQYEDTLNNIEKLAPAQGMFGDDELLGYKLDVETRDTLFNGEQWFKHPFDVEMNITKENECKPHKIDIVETFNYLIGLYVERMAWPTDGMQTIIGTTRRGDRTLVVWRDTDKVDDDTLRANLPDLKGVRRIYVNGDNNLAATLPQQHRDHVMPTEIEFQRRMFSTEE